MWIKVIIACLPAAVIGLLFDDKVNELFYNFQTVAIMLILFGIFFIIVENYNKGKNPIANDMDQLTFKMAVIIGLFQVIAAVFPGTSRSGATILGALLIGVSREVAAEFTFFLAIPVMFGASLLKLVKFGFVFTGFEMIILSVGFNSYPAKVFMGDTGSMALGGAVVAFATLTNSPLIIIIVGFIYLAEALSVMIQVTYFKLTNGKRIFKMAPLHHHFEQCGWPETRVVFVFWIVTVVLCWIGVLAVF